MKSLLAVGVTMLLLAPPGAGLGFASLAASGSGSARCAAADAISVDSTGRSPARFSAVNAHGRTVAFDERQLRRATAVVATGNVLDVPSRGQLIALMTAITESNLRVLANTGAYPESGSIQNDGNSSDQDSVGLFQQRPASGWGTVANLMDPAWSSRAFYGGADGPNHGSPRGLLDIDGWQTMDPGAAAQAVQRSKYPDRYAVNEPVAEKLLSAIAGVGGLICLRSAGGGPPTTALPSGFPGAMIAAAASQLGRPYVWGGGNFDGPTGGGFDCSGLVLYAAYQASGGHLRLPHFTGDQISVGKRIGWDAKQPGDLIFFSYRGSNRPHHVAIYVGSGKIIHAPQTGDVVRYGAISEFDGEVATVRRLA